MAADALAERVRAALKGGTSEDLLALSKEVARLTNEESVRLVVSDSWGKLIAARLPDTRAFRLLLALSNARPPPALRSNFYGSLESVDLLAACATFLPSCRDPLLSVTIRQCFRNLARNPTFRAPLAGCLPTLVITLTTDGASDQSAPNLEVAGASAAALCNICCDNAFKAEAVRLGAVRSLLYSMKQSPTQRDTEDMVACLGVLVAGFPPGLSALFESGEAPALLACLSCNEHPPLQILAAEVLSDVASSSKTFASWLVTETDMIEERLGRLLDVSVDPQLIDAMLRLCKHLMSVQAFASKIQKGTALKALQRLVENDSTATLTGFESMGEDGRQGVARKDVAMSILSSVLNL